MSFQKDHRSAQKSAALQRDVFQDLESLVKAIERGENLVEELKSEVNEVNERHQNRSSTREDIAYLEDLLRCAKKKLVWEKHMESLSKRTPEVLARASEVMTDPRNPPSGEVREAMVKCLQIVRTAMERLEKAKVDQ